MAEIYTTGSGSRKGGKGTRPDIRRVRAALEVAKDNFPEIANFKFVASTKNLKGRYKIDGSQRRQLNMVVDTIKNYQNSVGKDKLAHFLPENMGMLYKKIIEKGSKKLPANPEKGLYNKMYNFGPEQIKYITDRITDETGQVFKANDYKNLIKEIKTYRNAISRNVGQSKRLKNMYKKIVELANDDIIQNLLKGTLDKATQTKILKRATDLVGGDVSIASRRLFQMAEAMSDTSNDYKSLGIKIDNNKANKIIATGRNIGGTKNRYAMSGLVYNYYGNVVDKALGAGEGKTFIGKYQQQIKNLLDEGRSPDEIFSLTASASRNLSPYAIFTQNLNTQVNSAIKGAYIDGALSTKHEQLQKIFKGRKYNQLNAKEKKAANDLVEIFEKTKKIALNAPKNPSAIKADFVKQYGKDSIQYETYKKTRVLPSNYKGVKPIYLTASEKKNIQLPEFDLKNAPSKSISNYKNFDKNLQSAFDKSYDTVGYSMKVPKEYLTQKQMIANLTKGTSMFGSKGSVAAGIIAGVLGYKGEDILKGTGLMDKEYELTASTADAPLVEKGLSTGEKVATGTAAAGTLGTKIGRRALSTIAGLGFGPTGMAALTKYLEPEDGYDLSKTGDRLGFEVEAALAPTLVKGVTDVSSKIKNPLLRKGIETLAGVRIPGLLKPATVLRAARIASPIGVASLVGEGIYEIGKRGYKQRKLMENMTEEEKRDFLADQYEDLGGVFGEGA